jgi:hypothetical protein
MYKTKLPLFASKEKHVVLADLQEDVRFLRVYGATA